MTNGEFRLALVIRDHSSEVEEVRQKIEDVARRYENVRLLKTVSLEKLGGGLGRADLILALGGDGTILRTCRHLGANQRPILGVNLGRLGFLADLSPQECCERFDELMQKKYRVVDHLMFRCTVTRKGRVAATHLGLNEVALHAGAALRMISVDLQIDGEDVATYAADGVILSTPVGSTAYNLAAGGPLLHQHLQAFVITPVSPHTLTNRPLVDSADRVYQLKVPAAPPGATLVIDGQVKLPITSDDVIKVQRAEVPFQLAKLSEHSYYDTLHRKLGWGGHPLYRR